ncbi:MAG: MFS transporter [Alphaproteobacteria bacterium]|jgi:predicted MFS family arabinose efflux permease|nr:MFS transporter [Alphaproteobacteria bacterium]MDP7163730.1 MFS transporter [Alphaproteobacteria bacterium]MDP7427160.1 MFS transporter [Alphaproteobacteria bacterium]
MLAESLSPIAKLPWRRRPEVMLMLMASASALAFATWNVLLNNFAIERAAFDGADIGVLQSLREVPGFLAFAVVFLLLVLAEQTLALAALVLLGLGIMVTGFFPSFMGLCLTTLVMSLGYHYYETLQSSLALQWFDKQRAPALLGRLIAATSLASLLAYALVYAAMELLALDFRWVYLIGGATTVALAVTARLAFPSFAAQVPQRKQMVLRRRYWLYYALVFMSGARRQIFVVFAAFLMVERFGFDAAAIALMFLVNCLANILFAERIGRLIGRWGERRALTFEYLGLILVFTGYAFVESAALAVGLYILDHLFFAMAIAIQTYFQKIADPADFAGSAGMAFTINHIAAVGLPVVLGLLWLASPAAVFLSGSAMALASLGLARLVPQAPASGQEWQAPQIITPLLRKERTPS